MKWNILFSCVVALLLSGCSLAHTYRISDPLKTAPQKDKPIFSPTGNLVWLVENSPLIFLGQLVGQESKKEKRGLIITQNDFQVIKLIYGKWDKKQITLTTLGGTIGEQTMRVSHMPLFKKNFRYIIFTDHTRKSYNPVTGNQDGVFLLPPEDSDVYNYSGFQLAEIKDNQIEVGTNRIEEYIAPIFPDPDLQEEDPQFEFFEGEEGGIVSIESSDVTEQKKTLSLDQFIQNIQKLSSSGRINQNPPNRD